MEESETLIVQPGSTQGRGTTVIIVVVMVILGILALAYGGAWMYKKKNPPGSRQLDSILVELENQSMAKKNMDILRSNQNTQ